ncbi:MAG: efflux RND transporter periplasmic adaptor subunit [Candidatus Lindowbacteria bacterium]|nr:efflux RND transporter periplasmic adaptor subunit [Candidatus Lindowbacteria bacterium]
MKKMKGILIITLLFVGIGLLGLYSFGPMLASISEDSNGTSISHSQPSSQPTSQPASQPHSEMSHAESIDQSEQKGIWTCAMHPQVMKDKAGSCPVCGMDLYFKEPSNPNVIEISDNLRRLIGIVTVPVEISNVSQDVRTVARVEINEKRIYRVHTRVQGWIENLYVNFEGARVNAGDPLLTIYSPELLATEEEYLLAREALETLGMSSDPDARNLAQGLFKSARRRLELFDVPQEEIARLDRTGSPASTITLYAASSGFVTMIVAREGMEVSPDMSLYTIADLSTVWITADVYENEMELIKEGMEAEITLRQLPGKMLSGEVDYIYPFLNPKSRTNKIRLTLRNSELKLRPGMYGNILLKGQAIQELTVPLDAVSVTGTRNIVFVETTPGSFSPREIKIGAQIGDVYVVLEGLKPGEKVVAQANYFLDSEASIRAIVGNGGSGGHNH